MYYLNDKGVFVVPVPDKIQGKKLTWAVFDDCFGYTPQERAMANKDVFQSYFGIDSALYKRLGEKPKKKDYRTIGVRFIHGDNLAKVYTYRIRKGAKVHLGMEVVTPYVEKNSNGQTSFKKVAVVVRIDKTPQDNGPYVYQFITEKESPL